MMTRKNFLGGLLAGVAGFVALRGVKQESPQEIARRFTQYQPRSLLPPKEIRRITNLMLKLNDGNEVIGWYDSTGLWYKIGEFGYVDPFVVEWRVQEIFT